MDPTILEHAGLSRAESIIYITLTSLGESTSGSIVQESKLQSSVVHRVLKQLVQKGLISFIIIGKDKHYQTTSPSTLLTIIEEKKQQIQSVLPALFESKRIAKQPNAVELFLGKAAVFRVLLDLIDSANPNETYLSFSLIEPHDEEDIVRFYKNYNLRRREKKLDVKVLANRKIKKIYERQYTKELLRKAHVRYTSFAYPQGIILFRNAILFVNWQINPSVVKITNSVMAEQFRSFFLALYNKEKEAY